MLTSVVNGVAVFYESEYDIPDTKLEFEPKMWEQYLYHILPGIVPCSVLESTVSFLSVSSSVTVHIVEFIVEQYCSDSSRVISFFGSVNVYKVPL